MGYTLTRSSSDLVKANGGGDDAIACDEEMMRVVRLRSDWTRVEQAERREGKAATHRQAGKGLKGLMRCASLSGCSNRCCHTSGTSTSSLAADRSNKADAAKAEREESPPRGQ